MKYVFKRIDEIDLRSFEEQMRQQYAALDTLLEGEAHNSEILSYVEEMIADGRPCKGMPEALFWGYHEPENMPGDARVHFFLYTNISEYGISDAGFPHDSEVDP